MEQKLGRYTIEEPLGEGSFAWVYRAFDQKLRRYVALKVLKPMWLNDSSAMRRFEQEATTMANLHHPHIAEIYDVDETEGQVYLAQFLVEGETLAHRLTQGALSWTETLAILKGMAAALDYAHGQGIIHRDIKPANILLDQDGRPYLSDFGLIRAAEGSVAISSSSGGMVGTASYMAPEQWRGQAATPATDVYALTCVAVEMLTGKRLFDAPSSAAIMTKHVMDPPEFPAQWPPDVPEEVTAVLQRGLAKDPAERIGSAGELISALETLSPSPLPVAEEDEAPTVPPPFATRAAALWLVDSTGQSYEVKRGGLTLGRSAKCDIRIDDPQASREHAKLEFDGQHCMVYDQGSANGTFVNRQRVGPEGQSLKPGDHLTIGEASLTLSSLLPAKPPAAVKEPPMPSPPSEAPPVKPVSRRSSRALGVVALFGGGLVLLIMVGVIIFLVIQAGGPVAIPAPEAPAEEAPAEEPAAEEPAAEEPAVEAPAELPQTITAPDGATMILIPAGPFEMGSDADVALAECKKLHANPDECQRSTFENEDPKHTVTLDAFYIDQYEVTNAQYVACCVDDGACAPPVKSSSYTRDSYYGNSEYDDYPVIYVNWR
jgi:serine/threonine protein kinase